MSIQLLFWVLVGLFILFSVSVAFVEKQHIRDLVPLTPDRSIQWSPYFKAMNEAAERLGFVHAGIFVQDRKSRMYQAHMAIWISPEGHSLLRISGGTTAGIEIKRTWLTSFVEPNRIIETTDESGMADLSGYTDRKWLLNAGLDEMVACHIDRLAKYPEAKRHFPVNQALAACEAMRAMTVAQMQKLGLASFINAERTIWKHTLKGAWLNYAKGFRGQLKEGKAQMKRMDLKRPGAK
ncbi:MAG: hypothetical protein H0X66_16780 [Verrucomicrobia bacterium]|nr:hypothetical protein [Verrucomicrobiota bacterium]